MINDSIVCFSPFLTMRNILHKLSTYRIAKYYYDLNCIDSPSFSYASSFPRSSYTGLTAFILSRLIPIFGFVKAAEHHASCKLEPNQHLTCTIQASYCLHHSSTYIVLNTWLFYYGPLVLRRIHGRGTHGFKITQFTVYLVNNFPVNNARCNVLSKNNMSLNSTIAISEYIYAEPR